MRPLRLEIEGLTAFADPTVVDFTGLQLFAITGTTGAGKSTLIDAMLLALFGKVPRVGAQYGQLISQGKDQILVRLEFAVAGERFRVARRIRRKGATQVQLERILPDGTSQSVAGKARDTSTEIERLLGIDYDAFTRSVVLPQGQFDEFLRGDPAERRKILVNLLDLSTYERMARLAGEHLRDQETRAAVLQQRLQSDFAAATPEQLAARRQDLAAVEQEQQQLTALAAQLAMLLQLAQQAVAAQKELARAQSARGGILRQQAEVEQERQREQQDAAAFTGERARLDAALAAIPADDPARATALAQAVPLLPPLLRALGDRPQLQRDANSAKVRLQQFDSELAAARAQLPALAAAVAAQRDEVAAADAELDAMVRADAAMHLRAELHAGGPCPVCEQTVRDVPAATPSDLAPHKDRVAAARQLLQLAERKHHDAERLAQRHTDDLPAVREQERSAAERLRRADAEIERARTEVATAGIDVPAAATPAQLTTLQRTLDQELQALRERARQRAAAQQQLDALLQRHRDAAARLATIDGRAAAIAGQLRDADAAIAAATAAATAAEQALAAAAPPGFAARGHDAERQLQDLARKNLAAQQEQSRRAGQLAAEVAQLRTAIAQAATMRAELDAATAAAALARSLAQLLRGDRFQDYVLEAAVQRLCRDGSTRLLALSNARYSLRHDGGDFAVVDHWNADRERSVRTLSGGETFLASLALSLALADSLRTFAAGDGRAGRLECLFIDEGFGALDGDALESAVQALEALQGGQRMVGVVTHLQALAERLPARIAVENRAGRARVVVG